MTSLQAIAAACEKASPAPWTFEVPKPPSGATEIHGPSNGDGYEDSVADWVSECEAGGFNASFICLARTALPEAIQRIEELERLLGEACSIASEALTVLVDFGDEYEEEATDAVERIAEIRAAKGAP